MRKTLLSLCTALLLFGSITTAHASAGSAENPLISKSFVHDWAQSLANTLATYTNTLVQEFENRVFGEEAQPQWNPTQSLPKDTVITLEAGASITLLSGTANVAIDLGSFVNASAGGAANSGRVRPYEKYIVCENSKATVTIGSTAAAAIEGRYTVRTPDGVTITPAPTPTPTVTPVPTATPTPTVTPVPTATPMPTVAPVPTATPTPTATPAPTPAPTPVVIIVQPTPEIIYVTVTPVPSISLPPAAQTTPTAAQPTPTSTVRPTAKPTLIGSTENKPVTFKDVSTDAWFYEELQAVAKADLIPDYMDKNFNPGEEVTVAEAIAMAARLHQLKTQGEITLKNYWFWPWWYKSYRSYALEEGFLDERYGDFSRKEMKQTVSRSQLVEIFYGVLPEDSYTPINTVPENALPDVKTFSAGSARIYSWYRAGILTGYLDKPGIDDHTFRGYEKLLRNETMVILARLMDEAFRVTFTID